MDFPWLTLMGTAIAGALSGIGYRRAHRLPIPPHFQIGRSLPSLSIIVPARNEATNLPRLLSSLRRLEYPGPMELWVVDDGSTDGTGEIARLWGAQVIRVEGPPAGWLGKPYALHQGALRAQGEWLLFTDADTCHAPDSAARVVGWALAQALDGVTLFPAFEIRNALEAAVLAVAFAGWFAALPDLQGIINGQYLLIGRSAYEASGGFAAVRGDVLEDLALGRRLQRLGFRIALADGRPLVRARMSRNLAHLYQAMARWSEGALDQPLSRRAMAVLLVAGMAGPMGLLIPGQRARTRWAFGASWILAAIGLLPWALRMGSPGSALLAPLGAALVAGAGTRGWLARRLGWDLKWKERRVYSRVYSKFPPWR